MNVSTLIRHPERLPLLALGVLGLLAGLWAGLLRLGWGLPLPQPTLPLQHGPLMVSGFLGTLIGLERAVALGRRWGYAAPLLTGSGALALVAGGGNPAGALLMTLGSAGLLAIALAVLWRQAASFTVVMALGSVCWTVGNALWLLGWGIPNIVPWWMGFLVLTIAGERLELSRVLGHLKAGRAALAGVLAAVGTALVLTLVRFDAGVRLVGTAFLFLTAWLLVHDVARRTVRQAGLPRFIAACLLSGYAWLGFSGFLMVMDGGVTAGPMYDAMLHAFFLGFVFSMIFGHAPVIFPAVLGAMMRFGNRFYVPLLLLHLSLLLRVAGDLAYWLPGRQWGGMLNVLTLLLFMANSVFSLVASRDSGVA